MHIGWKTIYTVQDLVGVSADILMDKYNWYSVCIMEVALQVLEAQTTYIWYIPFH